MSELPILIFHLYLSGTHNGGWVFLPENYNLVNMKRKLILVIAYKLVFDIVLVLANSLGVMLLERDTADV